MSNALEIFRALADATRLRMLGLLRSMELSVGELAQVLDQSQPRVSRHVKILNDVGLAERRKEGSWVFVGLGDSERVAPVLAALDSWSDAERDRWSKADAVKLAEVRAGRAAEAAHWFETHAGEWDAIRSLYVAESEVEAAMRAALEGAPVERLIDIGTGTGRMLELFAPTAESAIGVDRSSEMLRLARAKLSERGLTHAELRQADFYELPLKSGSADTVIFHHVLHFAQQPGKAIAESARLLSPGGRLLIADFAPHGREELRTRDEHARLGFSDEQISAWFAAANLETARIDTLLGGELTVKIWLARKAGISEFERNAA